MIQYPSSYLDLLVTIYVTNWLVSASTYYKYTLHQRARISSPSKRTDLYYLLVPVLLKAVHILNQFDDCVDHWEAVITQKLVLLRMF